MWKFAPKKNTEVPILKIIRKNLNILIQFWLRTWTMYINLAIFTLRNNFPNFDKIFIKLATKFFKFSFLQQWKIPHWKKAHHQGRSHGADKNKLLGNFWERKGCVDCYTLWETFWRIAPPIHPPTQTKIKILTWHRSCYIFGTIVVHNGKFDILVLNNYVISKIKMKIFHNILKDSFTISHGNFFPLFYKCLSTFLKII
jgi:hypothetical protein